MVALNADRRSLARRHSGTFDLIRNNNNNQQNGRRRGRGGGQGGGGMGGAPRPQGQSFGNNRLDIRQRGNATQLLEKYKTLARDAAQQGDRVVSEYYLQYADHYFRVLNEIRERQPEHQRGPRPGYDADDEDGQDVGNGYNPAYAAQTAANNNGNGQDDDSDERDYADDGRTERRDEPRAQQRDDRPQQRDEQRSQQRDDRPQQRDDQRAQQRDEQRPQQRDDRPRRDDQRSRADQPRDTRQGEPRQYEPRIDNRRDEPRGDNRRDEPHSDNRRDDSRRDAPRQELRRDDAGRDERPRRDAERPLSDGVARRDEPRAPLDADEPMIAGLPGPATLAPAAVSPVADTIEEPPRRKRGRPRKVDVEAAAAAAALAGADA